jgi:methionyl-tRNA synthetase
LAQRLLSFVAKNCESKIPAPGAFTAEDIALLAAAADGLHVARAHVEQQNLKGMTETIINIAKLGNKYIDVQAPWTLRKTDEARMRTVLYVLAETIRIAAVLLSPVMSKSCNNMLDQLGMRDRSLALPSRPALFCSVLFVTELLRSAILSC